MYKTPMSRCYGCFPNCQENQMAHMGPGGCLYCEEIESDISLSSSIHELSEVDNETSGMTWAQRVVKTIEENDSSSVNVKLSNSDIENECCICYETIGEKNNCVTECGHKFCFKCLATAMTHNNACPCCRAPLVDVPEEDNDDDGDYEDDEEDSEDGDEDDEAPVEVIVERLKKNGFKMIDVVSLFLCRFSKVDEKYTDWHINELTKKFDEIQVDADTEVMEQRLFAAEDRRAVA
jgi:hypothetical protein